MISDQAVVFISIPDQMSYMFAKVSCGLILVLMIPNKDLHANDLLFKYRNLNHILLNDL